MDPPIVIKDEEKKLAEALAAVSSVLAGLSNKQAKQVLAQAAIKYDVRLVSVHAPIGAPSQTGALVNRPRAPKAKAKAQPKALWKQEPEWIAVNRRRSELLTKVKAKTASIEELHLIDDEMKALRETLRAKYAAASN